MRDLQLKVKMMWPVYFAVLLVQLPLLLLISGDFRREVRRQLQGQRKPVSRGLRVLRVHGRKVAKACGSAIFFFMLIPSLVEGVHHHSWMAAAAWAVSGFLTFTVVALSIPMSLLLSFPLSTTGLFSDTRRPDR